MSSIYKAYDIRGLHGTELDRSKAFEIGRAFAQVLSELREKSTAELTIGLGRDMRLTAPAMAEAVASGLTAEGARVLDAGMVPTELVYHLVAARSLDGGAIVTASHNPKQYTGIKLVREGALALSGEAGIGEIRDRIETGLGDPRGGGTVERVDIDAEYAARALGFIDPATVRPMKIVVDGGNGMAGPIFGPILRDLGLDLVEEYFEPDGNFPDHEPNPLLEENRRSIVRRVREEGARLGIAWDGDADRCFFIDDDGEFCDGDFIGALLARSLLSRSAGSTVLYDPRSSRAVPDTVAEAGGTSRLSRVGHAFFKARMREEDAIFGCEVSGHYYFRDFWSADSGLIPALLLIELIAHEQRSLSEMMDEFRSRYFISGEINSEVGDVGAVLARITDRFGDAEISLLDGISVDYDEWHFNVRPSNTEPLVRLNLESLVSAEDMARRRDQVLELIRE